MRPATLVSILLAGCATAPGTLSEDETNCAWRVCVVFTDTDSGRVYRVVNREPVPATVRLTFRSLTNLRPDVDLPVERRVPAESTAVLIRLTTVVRDRTIGAVPSIVIDLGSDSTAPDPNHPYAVPFGGVDPRRLVQGFHGSETHIGGMRYSLDFAMPEGTPVLAARGGTVLYVQDGFTEGAADPDLLERANLVVVAHSDGTMASYGHLAPGIPVSVGAEVAAGERLGLSGATGFAGQPHLHFHVGIRLLGDPGRTIPVRLRDQEGRALILETGSLVPPGRSR